jgi:hypothetical protein
VTLAELLFINPRAASCNESRAQTLLVFRIAADTGTYAIDIRPTCDTT